MSCSISRKGEQMQQLASRKHGFGSGEKKKRKGECNLHVCTFKSSDNEQKLLLLQLWATSKGETMGKKAIRCEHKGGGICCMNETERKPLNYQTGL